MSVGYPGDPLPGPRERYRQPGMPEGWTVRDRYPFYDGPLVHIVLEHASGTSHEYVMDRASFEPGGDGPKEVWRWIKEIARETP
jgi:hypothetical protein